MRKRSPHRQAGFSLLEVLVALLVFSFGLLGFVGLQARGIQYSVSAEDSNRAALLANEMATAIVTTGGTAASAPGAFVTAWALRAADPASGGLPNGAGTVTTSGNTATVTLTWRATSAASGAVNSVNRYVTQVIVP